MKIQINASKRIINRLTRVTAGPDTDESNAAKVIRAAMIKLDLGEPRQLHL